MGSGEDSRRRLLSVFLGRPWGSEGLRGDRKTTDADDDFLDITGWSLPLYDGRLESVDPSMPMVEVDVAVLGPVDVPPLSEGSTRSFWFAPRLAALWTAAGRVSK